MKIGIGTYAYRWGIGRGSFVPDRSLTPWDILDKAATQGVDLVQFADNLPLERLSTAELADLSGKAGDLGITIELGAEGLNAGVIRTHLEIAAALDARLVRVAPSAADAKRSNEAIAADLAMVMDACREQGVTIAVENHFHVPSPRLIDLVTRVGSSRFGVCLDVANSIACFEWPKETIALLSPHAVNLHLKDYRLVLDPTGVGMTFTGVPLGEGLTDIDGVLDALAGKDLNIILEHWLPLAADPAQTLRLEDEWLARSIAAIRDRLSRRAATVEKDNQP
jgi:sugar phosphate isomerase/epimerase